MAYQQNQPQLQSYQQPGIGRGVGQQAQLQQPSGFQPQFQQQPAIASQGSQPTEVWQTPQQTVPQQTGQYSPVQFPQQSSYGVSPTTKQGLGQQLPQAQVGQFPQQAGQFPQQASQIQPQQAQFQPQQASQSPQVGQLGTQPAVSSLSYPQGQTPQAQVQGQIPQQLGQQVPQQAQWSAGVAGQPTGQTAAMGQSAAMGQTAAGSGQSPTGQSFQPGAQSLSTQMQGFGVGSAQQAGEESKGQLTGTPSIDIVDSPDEIVLFVDLPGYKEENIKIQADGQNLTVSAERRDVEDEDATKLAQERPQKLQRTVRLPSRADVNEADATYENGVCKITLPKMEEEKQHKIGFQ